VKKKIPQIFTTSTTHFAPVDSSTLSMLEEEEIKESLIREYISELLTESAVHPKIMSMIDKLEQSGGFVKVKRNGISVIVGGHTIAMVTYDPHDGMYGKCLGSSIVSFSEAEDGFGPLAYDIAIEATGGLAPDRTEVSNDAENVWKYYMNSRNDVQQSQLDIPVGYGYTQFTPDDDDDDCEQIPATQRYKDEWHKSAMSKVYSKAGTPVIDELRKRGMIKE
jgi:hypothetical protein